MSIFRTAMRTHACGELTAEHADTDVVLCGWVASRRDHGGVTFIDLRDREGLVQVVFHPEEAAEAHASAQRLGAEDVVRVTGTVRLRPEGMANSQLPTGDVEVAAATLEVLSEAETPPFPIEDRIEAGEDLRLRYRYLDLRRREMTDNLRTRHRVNAITRDHMESLGFLEVETPMLTRSTPEGARDFLVPSRLWPGTFYALPQSPQQLKQLLMVAGQDRYYQIVRCLRDEAPRADRSFEFTQLDVEMSFADQDDVFAVIEPLYARYVREIHGVEVATPFPRIPYDEMLARFGTDKPDLRYGMELADLGGAFAGTGFNAFASVLASEDGAIKGLAAPGGEELSRKELDQLVQDAKGRGAAGLVWMVVGSEGVRSPVEKHLSGAEVDDVLRATGAGEGDLVCIVADEIGRVQVALDGVRRHLAQRLGLIPAGEWRYVWYTDPPLFDWSDEEGKWVANHHPFSAPATEDLDPKTAKAKAYDLVLNGFEVGGGSIRIHRPEVQRKVFEVLGLSEPEIEEKFGHLIRAFRYGAPPHGGIAMGMDRIVMLMAGKDAIRDVTAFPKAQSGADPLTGAPSAIDEAQLRELGIRSIGAPAGTQEPRSAGAEDEEE
jgi:aspartyl-tRNA synthetase